jgi:hypothetical protein
MFTKTTIALATALVLGSGIAALANDRDGEDGGFVLPGSMDGVNPIFHSDWFPGVAAQRSRAGQASGHLTPHSKAGAAFGYVGPDIKAARPRPLVAAPKEDDYGPEAGKD